MNKLMSFAAGLAGLAALGAVLLAPAPARAWGGVVIGLPPVVFGAPLYPPPPAYYYPPPAYYYSPPYAYAPPPAPPAQYQAPAQPAPQSQAQDTRPYGSMCHAGVYSCSAAYGAHVGDVCACSGIGAPSYGTVN
jgi:hypothetical protein